MHLGRFLRLYLLSSFVCVLIIPLLFNLVEIVLDRVQDPDLLYLLCALLPAIVSGVLVYKQRLRINSDDLQFYVRHRLGRSKSFLVHYFTISGLLVREICPQRFDFQALDQAKDSDIHTALMVYKAQGPDDLYAIGNNAQVLLNQQVSKLMPLVDNMFAILGLNGEYLSLAQRSFLQGLRAQINVEHEFLHLSQRLEVRGSFFCEYIFTTLVRTLLRALPEDEQDQYPELMDHTLLKEVGSRLMHVPAERINSHYSNRYFRLLTQECFNLKRQAKGAGFNGSRGPYTGASAGASSSSSAQQEFGFDGSGFSYRNGGAKGYSFGGTSFTSQI